MKIIQYEIYQSDDSEELEKIINEQLKEDENWQPLGGVAFHQYIATDRNGDEYVRELFTQAMVKYAP